MPSDELRVAVEQDAELDRLISRLQVSEPEMLVRAVASGDDSLVREALGLSQEEADELARLLYARAVEYAQRFPELRDAASFFGSGAPSSE